MGELEEGKKFTHAPEDQFAGFWRRIKDHRIAQWAVGYVAIGYGIQHGVTLTAEAFDWPHAVQRVSMLALVLGLPLVITFAWYHGERTMRRVSGGELSIISLLLVAIAILFYVFVRPSDDGATATRQVSIASTATSSALAPVQGAALSIAVLPLANLSGDSAQEFFSDGMTDEITSALAKVRDLRVVGRTSAFQFKGQNKDLRAIGQALGARYLIDGSVRKAGERVRITAELIEAGNGVQLWTENYDRELKDVFAVQEDIAQAIAASLRVPLGLKAGDSLVPNRGIDPDTHQNYLRAKSLVRARGLQALKEAAALLEQVVAHDPNYAPAWALLAEAYFLTPNYSPAAFSGAVDDLRRIADTALPRAEVAAWRAIQLDPNLPDGYSFLAGVQHAHGKPLLADDLYKQALALDAGNSDTLHFYGLLLAETGREKDALAMRQRCGCWNPSSPSSTGSRLASCG